MPAGVGVRYLGCAGGTPLRDECQSDFQMAEGPAFCANIHRGRDCILAGEIEQPCVVPEPISAPPLLRSEGRIEIELAGGHRISAEVGFDRDSLAAYCGDYCHDPGSNQNA